MNSKVTREGLFLLLALSFVWGINWPIMKFIVHELPPLTFRGTCLFIGGLGVLGLARATGSNIRIPQGYLGKVLCICLFNIVGWNVMATYGLSILPSGRAALLGYTMPLWTVLLSVWILKERFTWQLVSALSLGLGGIFCLVSASLGEMLHTPIGVLLMLAAAWSWSIGMILMKRWQVPLGTMAMTGWLLFFASLPLLVAAYWVDGLPSKDLSGLVWAGIIYNIILCFMFGYWAWNRLVYLLPVSVAALSSLLNPLIGIISGMLLLAEKPGTLEWIAALLILMAIVIVNTRQQESPKD